MHRVLATGEPTSVFSQMHRFAVALQAAFEADVVAER